MIITASSCGLRRDRLDVTSDSADATNVAILKCNKCDVADFEEITHDQRKSLVQSVRLGELKFDPGTYRISFQVCYAVEFGAVSDFKKMTLYALPGHVYEAEETGWLHTCVEGLRMIDRTAGREVWSWRHPRAGGGETYGETQ
jgi:hypothetical protein